MPFASIARSLLCQAIRLAAIGAAIVFAGAGRADEVAGQWRGVSHIRGTISIDYHEWVHESGIREGEESDKREAAEVQFVMEVDSSPGSTSMIWRATSATITGSIHGSTAFHINKSLGPSTVEAEYSGAPVSFGDFTLSLDPGTGVWQLASPGKLQQKYPVVSRFSGDDPDVVTEKSDVVPSVLFNGTVAGKLGEVTATYRDEYALTDQPMRGVSNVGRVQFWPEYDDFEVEVTIEGYANERPAGSAKGRRVSYAKWLPEGSIKDPKKPGNNLTARAVLKSKKGGTKDLPVVRSFRFELLETSREPGVCLNWPLDADDEDFDLRLASAPAGPGTLSDNDQRLEVSEPRKDGQGLPYADAKIECFDFGARSELRVTCLLEDGGEVIGLVLNAEGRRDLILLPQREPGDWIANAWRREHDVVALPGNDDSEETPGNTHHGDGYTLYEEYRGFAVRGHHVEGDPEKKDLCILNRIGSDAWAGIHMFETATGLRAIFRLLPSEMSADERVMNGNHRAAPHRGDQHGVCLVTGKAGDIANGGALTVFSTTYLHGRPGITKEIELPARNDPTSDFNKPWNLPPEDEAVAFDRAVAHELAHSVGAIHHGLGDVWLTVHYFPADDPRNKLGRPALFVGDQGERGWIQLLHETTKEDFLVHQGPVLEAALLKSLGGFSGYATLPAKQREEITNLLKTFQWYAGVENGQCSGDEQCLMRYYFAQVYQSKGTANTFYLVDPGSDDVGNILCASSAGTRTNGKDHDPQPRYFGANANFGCGDCRAEICPNDCIPPLPRRDGL